MNNMIKNTDRPGRAGVSDRKAKYRSRREKLLSTKSRRSKYNSNKTSGNVQESDEEKTGSDEDIRKDLNCSTDGKRVDSNVDEPDSDVEIHRSLREELMNDLRSSQLSLGINMKRKDRKKQQNICELTKTCFTSNDHFRYRTVPLCGTERNQ